MCCVAIILYMYVGDTSDGSNIEELVFQENYAKLCNALTESKVDVLLKHFVDEKIINTSEEEWIIGRFTKSEKVKKFLSFISGHLRTGDTHGFYVMLKLMKEYGSFASQDLAKHMASSLSFSVGSTTQDYSGWTLDTTVPVNERRRSVPSDVTVRKEQSRPAPTNVAVRKDQPESLLLTVYIYWYIRM